MEGIIISKLQTAACSKKGNKYSKGFKQDQIVIPWMSGWAKFL